MTTSVTYSEKNGILVQDGLDPLAGIKDPGPGVCINCGQYIPKLNHHYSQYFGYFCLPPFLPNGTDPRPITVAVGSPTSYGRGAYGSGKYGGA